MNNLYVIAIGGSGERILRSLTMALATGVDINATKVIPVIVDNDANSRALTQCKSLISAYRDPEYPGVRALYSAITPHMPSFCRADIADPIILDVSGGNIGNLKNVIGCPTSQGEDDPNDKAIKSVLAERELLFTESELDMPLDVGYVGCPNIGSVVMNSMSLTDSRFNMVMAASPNDGVIVVGSLFGGTGAAGIPLIVNKLLQNDATKDKPQIGVVAMLPYFQIDEKEGHDNEKMASYDVKSDIFDLKTRAALMYYDKHMSKQIDYMYYVGDDNQPIFKKSIGGVTQENPAQLCDLMAAMAIVDFAKSSHTDKTNYRMPIWGFTDKTDTKSNTSGILSANLKRAIVKFKMMEQVFVHHELFPALINQDKKTFDFIKDIRFDENKLKAITTVSTNQHEDAAGLNYIIKEVNQWLHELSNGNERTVRCGRTLEVFDNNTTVEADKLATAFYADADVSGMGLAKWVYHKPLFGKPYYEAIAANLLNNLQDAYHSLPNNYKANITDKQILPIALYYISEALDKVLDESFKL